MKKKKYEYQAQKMKMCSLGFIGIGPIRQTKKTAELDAIRSGYPSSIIRIAKREVGEWHD